MCESESEQSSEEATQDYHKAVVDLVTEMRNSALALNNRIKEFFDIICLWEERFNPSFNPEVRVYERDILPTPIKTWQQRWKSFHRLSLIGDALLILSEEDYRFDDTSSIRELVKAGESLCREWCSDRDKDHPQKGVVEAQLLTKRCGMARPILERLERTHLIRSNEAQLSSRTEPTQSQPSPRGATADQLMMDMWRKDSDAYLWTAKHWAFAINKSESTVKTSETWESIMAHRAQKKAERQEADSAADRHYRGE